ncbi:LOW QUALITY PROTEIN: hypothetical protein U9M48_016155 [Paspalum notatum var. saurae]|uniref:CCHC-type domain-containing protein n=1 Tax=Paspalum notatum var. saurae TaxID=547442 RepID=A0AAQ3T6R0_PASNO
MKISHKGRRKTRRIRNGMDEAEAGKRPKQCTQCGAVGHNYKKCPQNAVSGAAEAGPSGNATDGAPPSFEMTSSSRMAAGLPTPELLDADIDSAHRSYLSAVEHRRLRTFQCRPPAEYLYLDNRWLGRLHSAGLITFALEGGPVGRDGRDRPRMVIDPSLITALIDRWRPETHTFHLPCGEMTPTLQDVSYLLGFPIVGEAVGPRLIGRTWMENLEVRFAAFDRLDHLGALEAHPSTRGPRKKWLLQFQATNLHPDADDESVSRSFEAYLLWLFGFIMFKNGHGNTVDKILMPYAREIADADEDQVPTWSWGSAVLAATYRGLCDACIKDDDRARPYKLQYYGDLEDDRPTMGTLWVCPRERTWANEQARRTYPNFVAELDRLKADDVVWEPYSPQAVATRAPYGLSSWCTSNSGLWLTKTCLVYDIYVETHCPDRVMRQFGYQQPFPVPRALDRISRGNHRYYTIHKILDLKSKVFHSVTEHVIFQCRLSRLGQPCSSTWVQKLKPYVDAWDEADEDVFEPIGDHTDEWYQHFLTWYRIALGFGSHMPRLGGWHTRQRRRIHMPAIGMRPLRER